LAGAASLSGSHHEALSGVSEDHFAEFANLMGEQFDALRNTVNGAIERLSKRLDHLPAAPTGAGTATAARVQLSDLLGDALTAQRFKLAHKLSTGRTADAMIMMPGPMAPLAIDARFPAEAFDAWQMSRNAATEMELRRAVLRNIADAGEKLISPEETADCALMFVPSEHILSELHAGFSDLIQESYRARVWMVSPTSLMATLHTISAVMAGAGIKEASAANVIDELHALRGRVSVLETQRANGAHHPAEAVPEKSPERTEKSAPERSPSTPQRIGEAATQKAPDDKSPFPLR
jgi:DNA recombination protein RmuC